MDEKDNMKKKRKIDRCFLLLPKSSFSIFSSFDDIFDLLLLKDNDFCDAAVLHGHDYESYIHLKDPSQENDSFCFDLGVASDEVLMELENVIYYSICKHSWH